MADIRFKDLDEAAVPGEDYWIPSDSETDGVKKIKPSNLVSKSDIGLSNVDNTSDADKPVSDATQTALDGKATSAQGSKADSAVQPGDLGDLAVKDKAEVADIDATGTPSSTTWLRGDGVWDTPAGGGDMVAANNLSDLTDSEAALRNLSFLQSGTGAVARPAVLKMRDVVSVKDFNAKGDGSTDDTAAMQAAHDTEERIYYPRGDYVFDHITMSAPNGGGGIVGDGWRTRLLSTNSGTHHSILYEGANTYLGPTFKDFQLQATTDRSANAAIRIQPASGGEIFGAHISGLFCWQSWFDILSMDAVSQYSIVNNHFVNYSNIGVTLSNSNHADSGDGHVSGNMFNTARSSGSRTAVRYFSGGGLRFTNNKILGGVDGFQVLIDHNTPFADLYILGNSIENLSSTCVRLDANAGTTGHLGGVYIHNNNVSGDGSPYSIFSSAGRKAYSGLIVTGNTLYGSANNLLHLALDWIDTGLIASNQFDVAGGTTGAQAYYIDSNCNNIIVGVNSYRRLGSVGTINSSSCLAIGVTQRGVSSATASSGYGSMYTGSVGITFPIPFKSAPKVEGILNDVSGLGGVSCFVSSISATGFTMNVVGITSGNALPFSWSATGDPAPS